MTIRLERSPEGVVRLTLCRSAKHNALDGEMIARLTHIAREELTGARALIIAAEGESFCSGADLGWMREQFEASPASRQAEAQRLQSMLQALDSLPLLVIGLVQGPAYGGGVGLVAVCDVVIAAPAARFALTETRLGLIPAVIAPFLQRRIGAAVLRSIGLHGTMLAAEQALSLGLVTELAAEDGLEAAAARHVERVLSCAPGAVAEAKALFRALGEGKPDELSAAAALAARWQSEEAQAGVRAFLGREMPPWQNRRTR